MLFNICPSCGHESLETIATAGTRDGELHFFDEPPFAMFECSRCHWVGDTATLNLV